MARPLPFKQEQGWTGQEPETEASEKELIRELLYVFQGIEGSVLLRNSDGSFYLCPSRKDFYSPSTVQLTLRLAELGWLFNTIHGFIEHVTALIPKVEHQSV